MLQVARLAPKQLGESARLVEAFVRSQRNADGGFRGRAGASDLYYTVFGLEALIALDAVPPAADISAFLGGFGPDQGLDLVHLCCLVRCWADLCRKGLPPDAEALAVRIEQHRSADGGYSTRPGAEVGTAYGCFLALMAYQDLRREVPCAAAMLDCLRGLRAEDGGYANQRGAAHGLTPATAAAAVVLRHLGEEPPAGLGAWLLARCHRDGGFYAAPAAPVPDLLSTATALHALAGMHAPIEPVKEPCLDFVDSLWTSTGGFYAHWADDALDCEYTWYGLLALGHLSL